MPLLREDMCLFLTAHCAGMRRQEVTCPSVLQKQQCGPVFCGDLGLCILQKIYHVS